MEDIELEYINNIKLIHFLCNQFISTCIEYDELFSIANLTFVNAFNSYDISKGTFQTFFRKCFKNAVINEIKKSKRIFLQSTYYSTDEYLFCDLKLTNIQNKVLKLRIIGFTQKEIAERINVSQPRVSQILKSIRKEIENEQRI